VVLRKAVAGIKARILCNIDIFFQLIIIYIEERVMEKEKIELINKAFLEILPSLTDFIGRTLRQKDEKYWWKKYVIDKLSDTSIINLPKDGSYEECISSLDIRNCLDIITIPSNWKEIFIKILTSERLSYAHLLKERVIRITAHTTTDTIRSINEKDVKRTLENIAFFMEPIDINISKDIRKNILEYEKSIIETPLEPTGSLPPSQSAAIDAAKTKPKSDSFTASLQERVKKNKNNEENRSELNYSIQNLSWQEFVEKIKNERFFARRIEVIKIAKDLFNKNNTYSKMEDDDRKFIAGLGYRNRPNEIIKKDNDWLLFGSMKSAGKFKHEINKNNENISSALEQIPLNGSISKDNYSKFWEYYYKAFSSDTYIATATRLLCMKRPDYFICLDSANKNKLCKNFKIRQRVDKDYYWDEIINRIKECEWWKTNKPKDKTENDIWNARAAFIDSLLYKS